MEPEFSLNAPTRDRNSSRVTLGRMLPGLALCAFGGAMLVTAQAQPAWLNGHVGPGLMARFLGTGVIGLGAVWAAVCARRPDPQVPAASCGSDTGNAATGTGQAAPALLGSVLVFALSLPFVGLVLSAGLAAGLAAWGAGERTPRALAVTVAGLMALVALVGVTLLPPTTPLWPVF